MRVQPGCLLLAALAGSVVSHRSAAQATGSSANRGYRGPQVQVPGIFVTPVPNEPFSGILHIVSKQRLPDGSEHTVTTLNHVARQSSGRIYNERRALVPVTFQGEPRLLSSHIYDPSSHLNIFLNPDERIARESILPNAPSQTPGPIGLRSPGVPAEPGIVETDLGEQRLNGMAVRGLRRVRTVPAAQSGTGKDLEITDEYWYSAALHIYLALRHDDPRTGEQLMSLSDVEQREPDAAFFLVPAAYKVVDETPPER